MSKVRIATASAEEGEEQTEVHLCTGIVFRLLLLHVCALPVSSVYQCACLKAEEKLIGAIETECLWRVCSREKRSVYVSVCLWLVCGSLSGQQLSSAAVLQIEGSSSNFQWCV